MGESQNKVTRSTDGSDKPWSKLPWSKLPWSKLTPSIFRNLKMGNNGEIAAKIYEDFLRESKLIVQELIYKLSSLGADWHRITYETIIKDIWFYEACNNYINIKQEHRLHSLLSHLIKALNRVKTYGIEAENTEVENTSIDKVKIYETFDKIKIYKILLNFSINIYGLVKSNIRKYRKGLNWKQKESINKWFSDIEIDGKNFYKIRLDYSVELNRILIDSIKYNDTSLTTAINKRLKCNERLRYGEQLKYDINDNEKVDNCNEALIEYENQLIKIQNLYMPLVRDYYNENWDEWKDFWSEWYKIWNEWFAHMKEILAYLIKTLNERIKNKNSENWNPVKIYKDYQNLQDLDLNDEVSKLKKIEELLDKLENINENYTIYLMRFLVASHKFIDDMIDEASKKNDNFSSNMLKLFHEFDSLIGLFKDTNYGQFIIYNSYPAKYYNSWKPAPKKNKTDTSYDNDTNSGKVNITEKANNKLEKNNKNSATHTDFHTNLWNLENSPFDFDKINGTIGNMKDITNIIKSFIENRYFVDGDWGNDINYKLITERYIEGIVDIYNQIIDKKDKYEYQNKIFEANLKELRSWIIDLINKYWKISWTYKELKDTGDLSKIILKITLIGKASKLLRKTADWLNKLLKNVPSFSGIINQPHEIDDKKIMINNTIDIINNTFINGDKNSINGAKNSTDIEKNNTSWFYENNNSENENSQEFESFSKVIIKLLNGIVDAEDKCWVNLLDWQALRWALLWVFWYIPPEDSSEYYEYKTKTNEPSNLDIKWFEARDYSAQIKIFYNNVKDYLINWLEKYNDTYFQWHQKNWIRIFSKEITSADILLRVKNYLNNLGEEPQKISYTRLDDLRIKYWYWDEIKNSLSSEDLIEILNNLTKQELGNENFINEFMENLEKFRKSLVKMSKNISPEKNYNELGGIIILCDKLKIDFENSENLGKRSSIMQAYSEKLNNRINEIPDKDKTQIDKDKVKSLFKNFLYNVCKARNRIKNK